MIEDFNQYVLQQISEANSIEDAYRLLYESVEIIKPQLTDQIAVSYISAWIDAIEQTFYGLPEWMQVELLAMPAAEFTGRSLWGLTATLGTAALTTGAIIEAISHNRPPGSDDFPSSDEPPKRPRLNSSIENDPPSGIPPVNLGDWFGDGGDEIYFPKMERAAESLINRNIVTRTDFDRMMERTRQDAFTVAYETSEKAIQQYRDALVEDIADGASLEAFRDRVGNTSLAPHHLENVYRTNTQAAFRDGREAIIKHPLVDSLFPYQEYIAVHDARARKHHKDLESLGLDGTGVYRRDDPFWDRFTPPWDYNCILPETLVHGRIHTGLESWYDGEVVKIILSTGDSLSLTINHPIFTPKGLVESGRICKGDNLICDANWLDCISSLPTEDKNDHPRMAKDIFRSLSELGKVSRLPVRGNDFHGDAAMGDGYVNVVGAKRELLETYKTFVSNSIGNSRFIRKALGISESRLSGSALLDETSLTASSCRPSFAELFSNIDGILFKFLPFFKFGLGSTANRNSISYKSIPDDAPVASVSLSDCLERFAASVSGNDFGDWKFDSGRRFSVLRVVDVLRSHYSGPVYDFETFDGWQIAGGVKISNCRCGVNVLTVEAAARKGVKEAQQWLETGVPPQRPNWRLASIPFSNRPGFGHRSSVGV